MNRDSRIPLALLAIVIVALLLSMLGVVHLNPQECGVSVTGSGYTC